MFKSFFLSLIIISIIFSKIILAQDSNSIQVNGGIIMPMSSSKGLTTSFQFNYSFNPQIQFYIYSGYSSWDKFKVVFHQEFSEVQKKQYFNSYSADEHILIPLYLGSRINLHTNKLFTSFLNVEIGYSYLSYNSYEQWKSINPETGEVLSYHPNTLTKKVNKENLFGFGVGAGISHPMTNNLDLILSFRLNSYINSNYYGLFSTRGTYTMFLAGFNFNI